MAIVQYTISNGVPVFEVQLSPSEVIPNNYHDAFGTYQFNNVPDGDYVLIVTDGNDCVYRQNITVNPVVSTTTTTATPDNSIIAGNTDDIVMMFNENGTNRIDHYVGYPNSNEINLYLWLKTRNGAPLGVNKSINYSITGAYGTGNMVNFIDYNNKDNVFVSEDNSGDDSIISGQIVLEPGFIEMYLNYSVVNETNPPEFLITLDSSIEAFDPTAAAITDVLVYGITNVDDKNLIMSF